MNQATLDKSRQLRIKARINEAGVPLVLTFLNEDGSPHAINDLGWELPLKKAQNTTTNVWKLTEGDGLTVFGDDDNKLRIEVSQDRAEVTAQTYFWTLYSSEEDHTWLNGDWDFHNGVFDGVDDTEDIVIAENGSEITITITGDGGGISTVVVDDVTIQGDGSEDNPLAVKSGVFDASGAAAGVQTNLTSHVNNTSNPHSVTKSQVGLGNADDTSDASKPVSTAQQAALDLKADLVAGKVPASQLPAYVDDVLEYANFAALPGTGTTGIIYVTLDTNLTYRWSGSAYVEISVSLALGETSATAYRGDRGKTAYDHSQSTGNPHGTIPSDITGFNAAALAAAPAETTTTEGALINGATAKTTPVDADELPLVDSAASNVLKKLTWANLKASLTSQSLNDRLPKLDIAAYTNDQTAQLTDAWNLVKMNKATANAYTIPPNSSVDFASLQTSSTQKLVEIYVMQYGAGATSITAGTGVTIRLPGGTSLTSAQSITIYGGQYSWVSLTLIGSNEWALINGSNSILNQIAALSLTNDDILQQKSGAITNRTVAQYLNDLQVRLCIPIHVLATADVTLTNQANSEQYFNNSIRTSRQVDLSKYSKLRLTCYVSTASTSTNTPRLYPQYSTLASGGAAWTTIGSGTGTNIIPLDGTGGYKYTADIDIPAGAKMDTLLRVAQHGGDGASDPALAFLSIEVFS